MKTDSPPRAIKFRAWNKEERVMIDANSWYFSEEFEPFIDSVEKCLRRFELMQFTGLLDKNGTEIYEGDIIEMPASGIGEIVWDRKKMGFFWTEKPFKEHEFMSGIQEFDGIEGIEVIGNIHQHPDLLRDRPSGKKESP